MGWIGVFVHIDWENDDYDVSGAFFFPFSALRFSLPGMFAVACLRCLLWLNLSLWRFSIMTQAENATAAQQ
jgi:hypothetical protein